MWSKILLCVLISVAFASNNPGWKDSSEYVYHVRGRTLASLHGVSNQYSGILLKAQLTIRSKSDGTLWAKISQAKYGQVHTTLSEGWNTNIPDSELSYKDLSMSEKPFYIIMNNGVVRNIQVDKDVTNWEANIIKSIVSQFQLDTKAQNLVQSEMNNLPEEESNTANYKTMEDTVTGTTETMYDIHLLPEEVLASEPWLVQQQYKGEENVIEIVKNKNYSQSVERPSYHYGLSGMGQWKPSSNQMGQFFIRSSISRAVVTGKLERYTIHNSYTVNKIVLSPNLNNLQEGSVVSMLNVTLAEIRSRNVQSEELSSPVSLGNLVYRYNTPYSSNIVGQRQYRNEEQLRSDSNEESMRLRNRVGRSIDQNLRNHQKQNDNSYSYNDDSEEVMLFQDQPQMTSEPESPLLPFTMGYRGNSIKRESNYDVQKNVQKLAQEIGYNMQHPEEITSKDALGKFTLLSSLTRIMNAEELQQVANKLYTQSEQGSQRSSWVAFRDAVAESGTGPAFLTIQQWIETKKIQNLEAAAVVSTMAHAVRQPTEDYMRSFYTLIQKPEVKSQAMLNETALLSYTTLVRKVYVNKHESNRQYPVKSFGKFRTESGKAFVTSTVIPYLSEQLKQAISQADAQKIHVYIRALGNVAHQQILAAFEPYFEGKQQASQFQRLWMVVCMDKLVKVNPEVARSVLYKIYQNSGEAQELRVAAVYQLMRTSPPTDMLQRMAEYTNIDASEQVNAAVKSTIENAAELKGEEFEHLRSSAMAAKPLLNKMEYGIQYSKNYLHSYVDNEMKLFFKQTAQSIGSEDSILPKGVKYALRSSMGGLRHQLINAQAMISSVDELLHVFQQQSKQYKQSEQQARHGEQNKWSSENIARLLNLKAEEREQLEGVLNIEIGSLHQILSVDNHTVERLPQVIGQILAALRNGKSFNMEKLLNREEIALAFPTEMGLPFLFTHDIPTLISVRGKVQLEAQPQHEAPETISAKTELRLILSAKYQCRMTFVTPFDHQQYSSGYDKVVQAQIPIRGNTEVNLRKQQLKTEIELEQQDNSPLFHFSTWPYTSRSDIMDLQVVSLRPHTKHIYQQSKFNYDQVFGKKEIGMAFRVHLQTEQPLGFDLLWLAQQFRDQKVGSDVLSWWYGANIQHSNLNVYYMPEESSARKITIKMGCKQEYKPQVTEPHKIAEFFKGLSSLKQEDSHFHNIHIKTYDASIEFQGKHNVEYTLRGAIGKSNVDPKSLLLIEYVKKSNNPESKPFHISLHANNYIPNTSGLALSDAFKFNPMMNTRVRVVYGSGENHNTYSKIQAEIELRRSEARKEFLQQHPLYHQCRKQMEEGNYVLPACANMTANANLLDQVKIVLKHENIHSETIKNARSILEATRFAYYPQLEISAIERLEKDQIKVEAQFNPDLKSVNISVKQGSEQSEIRNIPVSDWTRRFVVIHPVFHLPARLAAKALGLHTYRQSCAIDQSSANTFNNKTYSVALEKKWTVMLQYVPKEARHQQNQQQNQQQSVEEQLKSQVENYAVLVRSSPESQAHKEIKITLRVPETEGKTVEIDLKPASNANGHSGSSPSAKVLVNSAAIQINDKESHDIKQGLVQIYALPSGDVKVEIRKTFYILFDGARVKLTVVDNDKFRDAVRGLCGQFNGEKTTDFLTSQNCFAHNAKDFVNSYVVDEDKQTTAARNNVQCYERRINYANVVSAQDAARDEEHQQQLENHSGNCIKHQTRYVEQNGEICFTTRPLPVCQCQQSESVMQEVPVHCIKSSNVAQLWKNQIDNGASPDFSHKQETKTAQIEVPQNCSQ